MDLKLEELLGRYIEGISTSEEEAILREQLKNPQLTGDMKQLADLFAFCESERSIAIPDDQFDKQLLKKIEKSQNPARLGLLWKMAGIAAAILMIISLSYVAFNEEPLPAVAEDTYTDPKKAFEETKKALMMLSSRFNEGTEQVEKLETFQEVQDEIILN